jgi:hypothetical protein
VSSRTEFAHSPRKARPKTRINPPQFHNNEAVRIHPTASLKERPGVWYDGEGIGGEGCEGMAHLCAQVREGGHSLGIHPSNHRHWNAFRAKAAYLPAAEPHVERGGGPAETDAGSGM